MPEQYYQSESGLNYNYQRDYDPFTAKYVESDPIGLKGGIDPYAYVDNDPLFWVDPSGLRPANRTAPDVYPGLPVWPWDTTWSHDATLALDDWLQRAANAAREGCKEGEECLR